MKKYTESVQKAMFSGTDDCPRTDKDVSESMILALAEGIDEILERLPKEQFCNCDPSVTGTNVNCPIHGTM